GFACPREWSCITRTSRRVNAPGLVPYRQHHLRVRSTTARATRSRLTFFDRRRVTLSLVDSSARVSSAKSADRYVVSEGWRREPEVRIASRVQAGAGAPTQGGNASRNSGRAHTAARRFRSFLGTDWRRFR